MTDKTRIRVAAIVTALFLAGISAVGLAARGDAPAGAPTPAAAPARAVQPQSTSAPIAQPAGYDEDKAFAHEGGDDQERGEEPELDD